MTPNEPISAAAYYCDRKPGSENWPGNLAVRRRYTCRRLRKCSIDSSN